MEQTTSLQHGSQRDGEFIQDKFKQMDEKKYTLKQFFNEITSLSSMTYQRGTRDEDYHLRDRIDRIKNDLASFQNINRSLDSVRSRDLDTFREVLDFYTEKYFNANHILAMLGSLRGFIEEQIEKEEGGEQGRRVLNVYARDLLAKVNLTEKKFNISIESHLRDFLLIINDLHCYAAIMKTLNAEEEEKRGPISAILLDYLRFYLKTKREFFTEKTIKELLGGVITEMKLEEKLSELQFLRKSDVQGIIDKLAADFAGTLYRDKDFEEKTQGLAEQISTKEVVAPVNDALAKIRELLSELTTRGDLAIGPQDKALYRELTSLNAVNLAKSRDRRYLFHSPENLESTLQYVAEQLRDSLTFVVQWLIREAEKGEQVQTLLEPLILCVPDMASFAKSLRIAREISSHESNQAETYVLSKRQHFIPRETAKQLLQLIGSLLDRVKEALVNSRLNIKNAGPKAESLMRRIGIVHESYIKDYVKIKNGYESLDKA